MNVSKRLNLIQILEKMENNQKYSKKLGLENNSSFSLCKSAKKNRSSKKGML